MGIVWGILSIILSQCFLPKSSDHPFIRVIIGDGSNHIMPIAHSFFPGVIHEAMLTNLYQQLLLGSHRAGNIYFCYTYTAEDLSVELILVNAHLRYESLWSVSNKAVQLRFCKNEVSVYIETMEPEESRQLLGDLILLCVILLTFYFISVYYFNSESFWHIISYEVVHAQKSFSSRHAEILSQWLFHLANLLLMKLILLLKQ